MSSNFENVSSSWDIESGRERWLRNIDDKCWISVLHRRTGFGYMEWESAIVFIRDDGDPQKYARGKWDDRETLIILGDRRQELERTPKDQLRGWYESNIEGNRSSMETLLNACRELSE